MAKKTMNETLVPVIEDETLLESAEVAADECTEADFEEEYVPTAEELTAIIEELKVQIADLEQKENTLAGKLALAREAELAEQTEKCRALLLKVVMAKREKKATLKQAEADLLAMQLDDFAEELENELNPPLDEEELEEINAIEAEQKRLYGKAKRGKIFSKVLSFIALFAGIAGALVYLILSQPDVLNIPFDWMYLAIDAAAMIVLLIVAGCIKGAAKANARKAEALEPEVDETEIEEPKIDIYALDREQLDAISEAYAIEKAGPKVEKQPKKFGKITLPQIPEKVKTTVKDNADKIIPVAAICTAIVAGMCISSSKKKAAARKRSAAARRDFFNWLG